MQFTEYKNIVFFLLVCLVAGVCPALRAESVFSTGATDATSSYYYQTATIGEGIIGFAEGASDGGDSKQRTTLSVGFETGDYVVPQVIHYMADGKELFTDTLVEGCPILEKREAPKKGHDSLFAGWSPALPEVMPGKDMTVNALYKANGVLISQKIVACPGETNLLSYSREDGAEGIYKYTLEFDDEMKEFGFVDVENGDVDNYGDSLLFEFPVPEDYEGLETVKAKVRMKYEDGSESPVTSFEVRLGLPSSLLTTKYGQVVMVHSEKQTFMSYQWYKNDEKLVGAVESFVSEPNGIYGSYGVDVVTMAGESRQICSRGIYIEKTVKHGFTATPCPANFMEPITLTANGFGTDDLKGATLEIYDVTSGKSWKTITNVTTEQMVSLPSGVFICVLMLDSGRKYVCEILVK